MSEPNNTPQELTLNENQSYSDEARLREAELAHDLGVKQLQFEKERYENARPKSEREIELEYAYKNRVLDNKIENELYKRSWGYKAKEAGTFAAIGLAVVGVFKFIFNLAIGGDRK